MIDLGDNYYTPTRRVVGILEYPCPSVRPSLNLVYVTSHLSCWIWFIFGILVGHDLSMCILYRFHRWLIFARVIALFMFVWPYVRPHILCTQLVICLLSHFIHIWYLGWPWYEHAHILLISQMVDFCESYCPFHVCLTIRPSAHLVYATSHLSFVAFYSYLVSWLAMIWACAYYTDFTDGWFLQELFPFSCLFDHMSVRTSCVGN